MPTRRMLLTSATIAALSLAAPMPALAKDPMPVVATFSILGDMVARVGGDHIALTTLVGPNGDSHVYQPTPQDARAVNGAKLLFLNGLEFEGWIERLAEAAEFKGEEVVATAGIEPIAFEEGDGDHHDEHGHDEHGEKKHDDHAEHDHDDEKHEEHAEHDHDEHKHEEHAEHDHDDEKHDEHAHDDHGEEDHAAHDHDDHHGHDHGAFDPHAWQSLKLAVTYVDNIAAALAKADPANAGDYYQNRAAYVAELEALNAEISAMMAALPEDKRIVVTSHDAFQYFGRDYGLTFLAAQGLSTESEASAKDVAHLIEEIREEGISAVFIENVADKRLLEQVANETGATIGGRLYPGALSPADGPAGTYLDMMRHNAVTIAGALGS